MGLTVTYIIIGIYSLALLLIFFYSLSQLNLLLNYLGQRRKQQEAPRYNLMDPREIPFVTIQLPIYNEKYVVGRLLENIASNCPSPTTLTEEEYVDLIRFLISADL